MTTGGTGPSKLATSKSADNAGPATLTMPKPLAGFKLHSGCADFGFVILPVRAVFLIATTPPEKYCPSNPLVYIQCTTG